MELALKSCCVSDISEVADVVLAEEISHLLYCPHNEIFWSGDVFQAEVSISIPFKGNWIVTVEMNLVIVLTPVFLTAFYDNPFDIFSTNFGNLQKESEFIHVTI